MYEQENEKKEFISILKGILFFVALVIGTIVGIWQVRPLQVDESNPQFQNMMANIRSWAIPRPMGSPALAYVRGEIVSEIENMGLVPVIHEVTYFEADIIDAQRVVNRGTGTLGAGFQRDFLSDGYLRLYNILVGFESPYTDRVIMFVSHYDSVPNSPGAGDAMLPIAAMVEAIRELSTLESLANNIYFLLTDAEEYWAMGALAFVRDHPDLRDDLRDRIDMLINLEAVGNAGGPVLFQTSPQPASMIRHFNRAVPRPIGFSFAGTIYDTNRFWTDFCVFLYYDIPGVNLAITKGQAHYHRPSDTYYNLNRDAAYNYMQTVLSLARYFAANPIEGRLHPSRSAVFFTFLPGNMIVISYWLSYVLGFLSCLLALAYIKIKRKKMESFWLAAVLLPPSVVVMIVNNSGAYFLWIPLLLVCVTGLLKHKPYIHFPVKLLSVMIVAIIWAPALYLAMDFFV